MEDILKTYKKLKDIQNIEDIAYNRLYKNYIELKLSGDKKLIDIDSTNQEDLLKSKYSGVPRIGMIYTFIYMDENSKIPQSEIIFHDKIPLLFCTSVNMKNNLIKGLNLNLLPPEGRLKFLDAFYNFFETFFKNIERKTEYNLEAINTEYERLAISGKNSSLIGTFNNMTKSKFEFSYRSYDMKFIRNLRMIEYQEWQFIPHFHPKHAFKRINLSKLYDIYKNSL